MHAELRTRPPSAIVVGRGTAIRLEGTCAAPGARIVGVETRVGDNVVTGALGRSEPDEVPGARRWDALVPIGPITEPASARIDGSSVPNAELHRHYSAADIVLNDHWPEMRAHGFLSNRLYDALACASCVVSDHVEGIEEEFDDAVVTVRGGEELRRAIDRLMRDPGERTTRGQRGRKAVLERHTFDRRVEELLGWVEPLLAERPRMVVSGAPGEPRPEVTAHPRR